ncbi:organic solute transporter Ostalpha-domain-containing protein [Pelagophyceae sp. CCMP2097]|nr:organic solute transporter Ostalpha-domain-containing protein [Pelagophyceae sp. CCMP2097]
MEETASPLREELLRAPAALAGAHLVDDDALLARIQRRRRVARAATRWAYISVATLASAVVLPGSIYWLASRDAAMRQYLLPVACTFAFLAVPVSLWGIAQHVSNYWQPVLQRYVVRILWLVPVYSLTSLIELFLWLRVARGAQRVAKWCVLPRAVRGCYEAYTVLNFFYLMVTFLEVHYGETCEKVLAKTAQPAGDDDGFDEEGDGGGAVRHPCPPYSWCVAPWSVADGEFLRCTRFGVLLFTTLMPVCALVTTVDSILGAAAPASAVEMLQSPTIWAGAVQFNLSNHAIYCLGLFFYTAHDLLAPCQPHAKFVAVKGIVFGTFFQDLGIDAVFYCRPHLAEAFGDTSADAQAALGALKCALLSVEMLGFAILHAHAFPAKAYPRVRRGEHDADGMANSKSADWLAAWGDYYAQQQAERRLWRARGGGGEMPRDGLSYSQVIFDVRDVHTDTAGTLRDLRRNAMALPRRAVGRDARAPRMLQRLAHWRHHWTLARASDRVVGAHG